ncbi:hypothetical protein [Geoalkalibacter halelectricus]|uniref:Surface antigen n=1 Tax=Geoalkalibacter halelectricus TaxID=2847045 RepID=A0ABY5ZQE9_9BACT|nr:hypothetical protein [Geoalkalibacter halelectricus]MDO3376730.1 hypothetical protein [Geoalkalibacter halelectricus]UWZ81318.1 hypothetical protein L9S41_07985 [Geoalkalibacter halelectricus]
MIAAPSRNFRAACLLLCCCFLVLILPSLVFGTQLRLTSDTILQSFERDLPDARGQKALPAYQYLQIDYGDREEAALSFHGYGWMRINLGDDYFDDTTTGQLLYAYLEYDFPTLDFVGRLGRFYVFEGVANVAVDGIYGRSQLPHGLTLSAYAGQPAALSSTNGRSGDYVFGGRISHHRIGRYEVGLSYKALANDGGNDEHFAGFDSFFFLPGRISLQGSSVYNLKTDGWAEHFYELRLPLGPVEFRPFYQRYRFDDFFIESDSSAFPFRFLAGTGNTLEVMGAEAFLYVDERFELAGVYKHYEYGKRFGSADYYSLISTWKIKILSQVGIELGRMDGDQARDRFTLARGFFYWDMRPWFVTGDAILVDYDRPIFGKDQAWFASLGLGRGLMGDRLKVKFSFDYSDDPYLDNNFRTTLAAHYLYD